MLMDDRELATAFSESAGAAALSGATLRKGMVTGILPNGTIDVLVGGSSVPLPGVRVFSNVCPRVGAAIWLAWIGGTDPVAIGTEAPVGPAYAKVRRTSDQNIADGADVLVAFGNPPGELEDPWGMYSQPNSLIIPVPGIYALTFTGKFSGNATGYRRAAILLNGTTVALDNRAPVGSGTPTYVSPTTLWKCARGDAITAELRQSSGITLQLQSAAGANAESRLSVTWLGAA